MTLVQSVRGNFVNALIAILIRSRVLMSLQQNVTIVQRASCFRCESGPFFFLLNGPRQRASMILPPHPMWTAGSRELRRGRLHSDGFVTNSQSEASDLWHSVPSGLVREWLDLWHKLRWGRGAWQIPEDFWYEGMLSILCNVPPCRSELHLARGKLS